MSTVTPERVMCSSEDHARPAPAIARVFWPDGRFRPLTACIGHMQDVTRGSLDEGHPVLLEPPAAPLPVAKAMREVANLYRRAYSEPVKAILLEAPDMPHYEELPETLEERRKLPARFHVPHWLGDCTPTAWVCAVCWGEDVTYGWPCATAMEHGGEVFAR